eukprot:TRINITY_DN9673_c0_g1_i5.p1 TRINITY_DN9673_c0_g1~~TRINITY_DN9673_c0_g1_i5.p1  ORF type:complete len:286 (+),score=44.81 TRINITY_DN9673_c0_g1_i5:58-915(+)
MVNTRGRAAPVNRFVDMVDDGFLRRHYGTRAERRAALKGAPPKSPKAAKPAKLAKAPLKRTPPAPVKVKETKRKPPVAKAVPKRRPPPATAAKPDSPSTGAEVGWGAGGLSRTTSHTTQQLERQNSYIKEGQLQPLARTVSGEGGAARLTLRFAFGPVSGMEARGKHSAAHYTPNFLWGGLNWRLAFFQMTAGHLGVWLVQNRAGVAVEWEASVAAVGRRTPDLTLISKRTVTFTGELTGKGIFAPNKGDKNCATFEKLRADGFVTDDRLTVRLTLAQPKISRLF